MAEIDKEDGNGDAAWLNRCDLPADRLRTW